jgi:hypothetical protein
MDIASIIVSGIFGKSLDILFEHYPKVVSYVYANTHGLKMNIVKSFSFKSPYYVFVYGSSLDPENLKRTLEIDFDKIEYLPVILTGYRFEWGAPHVKMNLVVQHHQMEVLLLSLMKRLHLMFLLHIFLEKCIMLAYLQLVKN